MDLKALARLNENADWKEVRAAFETELAVLDSIDALPDNLSYEQLGIEVRVRRAAVALIRDLFGQLESAKDELAFQQQPVAETPVLIVNEEEQQGPPDP